MSNNGFALTPQKRNATLLFVLLSSVIPESGFKALKKIGILYNPLIDAAGTLAQEIKGFLSSNGVSTWLCSAREEEQARSELSGTDLIISVGGDGTILRASQVIVPRSIPIVGVNLGKLGFMTELGPDEVWEKLPVLLDEGGWVEERVMLEAELFPSGDKQGSPKIYYALNDVVVGRGAIARVVYIETSIDDKMLTSYKADGVILATATGSTGYSLAAGGPILSPQAKEFLLLPLLPHLSLSYTLALPSEAVVKLKISTTHEAVITVDGQLNLPLSDGALVKVKRSSATAHFLRVHPPDTFYSSLEQKLKGRLKS